eukprot:m.224946 g.224946  ORF g.224946 m.224946 type:complete len:103 (-) comp15156_c0_seq1:213-521(-)
MKVKRIPRPQTQLHTQCQRTLACPVDTCSAPHGLYALARETHRARTNLGLLPLQHHERSASPQAQLLYITAKHASSVCCVSKMSMYNETMSLTYNVEQTNHK